MFLMGISGPAPLPLLTLISPVFPTSSWGGGGVVSSKSSGDEDWAKVSEFPAALSLPHMASALRAGTVVSVTDVRAAGPGVSGCGWLISLILGLLSRSLFVSAPLMSGCSPSFLTAFSVISTNLSSLLPRPPLIFCF